MKVRKPTSEGKYQYGTMKDYNPSMLGEVTVKFRDGVAILMADELEVETSKGNWISLWYAMKMMLIIKEDGTYDLF